MVNEDDNVDADDSIITIPDPIPLDDLIVQIGQLGFGIIITMHPWAPSIIKVSSPNWRISNRVELPKGIPFTGGITEIANKLYRDTMLDYYTEGKGIVTTDWPK